MPANTLATREAFFLRERQSWAAFQQTWADLPEERLHITGACGPTWSIKDVINHTAVWQEAAIRIINDLLSGRWARLGPNTEKFNALNYEEDRQRASGESIDRLLGARETLLQVLHDVTEDQLLNEYGRQQIGWWAKWTTYGHYEQHLQELTAFRQRTRKATTPD